MSARRKQPPPNADALTQQLGARFQPAAETTQEEPPAKAPTVPGREREADRVRRTYYLSREVANELAALAGRIHYGSNGEIPKHQAYDEIIRAGLERADEIEARHQG